MLILATAGAAGSFTKRGTVTRIIDGDTLTARLANGTSTRSASDRDRRARVRRVLRARRDRARSYESAETLARSLGRGLWGACTNGTPPPPGCDPSYPTVCIPPYPPDLDCGEIPYVNFTVVGSDPHGFDGDGDGVGCET